ncbi:MAG TPA: ABC transporter ATP-binding protein [Pyrinomonadaceae bacterium]|jgi:lipopolysaccharide transport system ATP-binding protein
MSDIAVRCEGISKRYRLGQRESYRALRDVLTTAVATPFRRLRSGPQGALARRRADTFWALKDVSFEIREGEVVGIIGRNGAGKSTLLKILSRITRPTRGEAYVYGRVGSLLEVGTGFHPELTGRENIFLNGAILGMRHAEIKRKFDEIVAFANVERFIDTPVKHYSSGMYVRLAFGVSAHLEPEVLVIDEVLAVGDAEFQKKCLGKMDKVAQEGRTVIFVSHNMTYINQLCSRTILLADGQIARQGRTAEVVADYLSANAASGGERVWTDEATAPGNSKVRLRAVRIVSNGAVTGDVDIDKEVAVEVEFWNFEEDARNLYANIYLLDKVGNVVLSTANTPVANLLKEDWYSEPHRAGLFRATCTFPANFLNEGLYHLNVYILTLGPIQVEASAEQVISFTVFDTGVMREPGAGSRWDGVVRVRLPWRTEFVRPHDGSSLEVEALKESGR